jgi:hypothetical protein
MTPRLGAPAPNGGEHSLGELIVQLKQDTVALVDSEVQLLKAEAAARGAEAKSGLVPALVSFAAAVVGLMAVTGAAVIGLGDLLGGRYGLSALLLGGLLFVSSGIFQVSARKHFRRALETPKAPPETRA